MGRPRHEGGWWGAWRVTPQHVPLPGQPGQMETWSTWRKLSLLHQEANLSWPETSPSLEFAGQKGISETNS